MTIKGAIATLDDYSKRGRSVSGARPICLSGREGSTPIRPHLVTAINLTAKNSCDRITDAHHSYVKSTDRGGRAVDYLIYDREDGNLVGTIGYAFAGVRLPGTLFSFYQISQVRAGTPWVEKVRKIAVCYRYTLMEGVPANFASRALSVSMRLLATDWKRKYSVDLIGVFTLVKPPWKGSCFRACNYVSLGYTQGSEMNYTTEHHKTTIMAGIPLIILAYRYGRKTDGEKKDTSAEGVNEGFARARTQQAQVD